MSFSQLHLQTAGNIASVATVAELPASNVVAGSVRYIRESGALYTFDGTVWGAVVTGITTDELIVIDLVVTGTATLATADIIGSTVVLNSAGIAGLDAGLIVNRGSDPDAQLAWDESEGRWYFGTVGDMALIPITALELAFNNTNTSFTATNVQAAIEEAALGNINETTFIDSIKIVGSSEYTHEIGISATLRDLGTTKEEVFEGVITLNDDGEFTVDTSSSVRIVA